jgi:hypothetical protein
MGKKAPLSGTLNKAVKDFVNDKQLKAIKKVNYHNVFDNYYRLDMYRFCYFKNRLYISDSYFVEFTNNRFKDKTL